MSARSLGWSLLLGGLLLAAPARAEAPPPVDPPLQLGERATRDAALIIGNEGYSALPQVIYAHRDARSVRDWLSSSRGLTKRQVLYVEDATRAELEKQLRRAAKQVRGRGTLWIYFSGHGSAANDAGARGLLGVDASPISPDEAALSLDRIVELARSTRRAERIVIIVDAGFGNVGRDGLELVPGRDAPKLGALPDYGPGVDVWLATADARAAEAYPSAQKGLFTYLMLGALRGWADGVLGDPPDGKVTWLEAQVWVDQTGERLGRVTLPTVDRRASERDWPIVQGSGLEQGPDAATLRRLSLDDRLERFARREDLLKAEASAFWGDTLRVVQQGGPAGREALEGFIAEYERASVQLQWAVTIPEVDEARRILFDYNDNAAPVLPQGDTIEPCDDLVALEQPAMLGQFSTGQRNCLENRIRTERLQTTKNHISRLLLVNSESAGDQAEWARLMARHLEDIDRSDPDLCFRYAVYLFRTGDIENVEESVRWTDYALENKQVWEGGDEFVRKVNSLLKLRAEASAKLWKNAEEQYAREATGDLEGMTREYRGQAKDHAREWLDYARAAGLEFDRAYNMCVSAAGTEALCRAE